MSLLDIRPALRRRNKREADRDLVISLFGEQADEPDMKAQIDRWNSMFRGDQYARRA